MFILYIREKAPIFREKMEKSVSIKHNKSYTCIYCEHSWSRNRDFERHLNTVKHEKKAPRGGEKAPNGVTRECYPRGKPFQDKYAKPGENHEDPFLLRIL
jgi:hypothetical protein